MTYMYHINFWTITNDLAHLCETETFWCSSLTAGLHSRNFVQLTASRCLKPTLAEKYVYEVTPNCLNQEPSVYIICTNAILRLWSGVSQTVQKNNNERVQTAVRPHDVRRLLGSAIHLRSVLSVQVVRRRVYSGCWINNSESTTTMSGVGASAVRQTRSATAVRGSARVALFSARKPSTRRPQWVIIANVVLRAAKGKR